jgi:hypothetical protein
MKSIILLAFAICGIMIEARKKKKNKEAAIENCADGGEHLLLMQPHCGKCKDGFMLELSDKVRCVPIAEAKCKDLECEVCESVGCTKCKNNKIAFNNLCIEDKQGSHQCPEHCGGCSGEKPEMCFGCKIGFSLTVEDDTIMKTKCVEDKGNCAVKMPSECALCPYGFANRQGKCVAVQGRRKKKMMK